MAKTKAELQADSEQHSALMLHTREELRRGGFQAAVHTAVAACQVVDGMMQYDRKWGAKSDFETVDSIALVLRYAPLLFDHESLEQLAELLKANRRIDKNAAADIAADLQSARMLMWDAYRLWTELESDLELRQDELRRRFGGDQDRWRWISESWEQIGVLRRLPERASYRISLITRVDERIRCKCPSCGVTGQAPKLQLTQEIQCPKCKSSGYFVWLAAQN